LTGPPAARPSTQEAGGAGPRGNNINPNYVRVINAPWNRHGRYALKRKTAEHYVRSERAAWVGLQSCTECGGAIIPLIREIPGNAPTQPTTLRMIESEELAAMRNRAAAGYDNQIDGTEWQWRGGVSGRATVMLGIRTEPRPQPIDSSNQTDSTVINAVAAGLRARAASRAGAGETFPPGHQILAKTPLPA
jgi:hypothetical protein